LKERVTQPRTALGVKASKHGLRSAGSISLLLGRGFVQETAKRAERKEGKSAQESPWNAEKAARILSRKSAHERGN